METSQQQLTFDQLPQAVYQLSQDVKELKQLLQQKSLPQESERWFDLDELTQYDPEKRTKPTFYGLVNRREIPFHKRGKKLTFLKSEIDLWLKEGRKKTFAETQAEAIEYVSKKRIK